MMGVVEGVLGIEELGSSIITNAYAVGIMGSETEMRTLVLRKYKEG